MSRKALRRAVGLSVFLIVLSLALGSLHLSGTLALWTGETANSSSPLEAGWVGPPTALGTPTPSGYGASLAWTPGTHGPVTGQQLYAASGGTGTSASCGTYALDSTMAGAATASYTTAGSSANNGAWRCYKMVSTSATAWTASAAFTPIRVGLYPTSVVLANGGTAAKIDNTDTITITFNQAVTATSASVCTFQGSPGVILIGDATCSSSSTDAYTVGKLTGFTIGGGAGSHQKLTTTITGSGTTTLVVKVTQNGQTVSGTGTFTATTSTGTGSLASSAGAAKACTSTSAPVCVVTPTGGF